MSTATRHQTTHEIDIAAPAEIVFGVIADATRWPTYFDPTVHVERTQLSSDTERLRIWATGNGVVRNWTSLRTLDPDRRRVCFRREVSAPPIRSMYGTWTAQPVADGRCRLTLTHDFESVDDDEATVAWITRGTDENSTTELSNVKRLAEGWDRRDELELSFEDSMQIDGRAGDVYAFLHDAAQWPQRLPHVAEMDLREEDGDLQLMAMWTRAKDGTTHLTESVRICFPDDRIVYKQTTTPAAIAAHVGEWLIEPNGDGVLVRARHTVHLDEKARGVIPAAGGSWASTREFVRSSIGGNSLSTLGFAKDFAESR